MINTKIIFINLLECGMNYRDCSGVDSDIYIYIYIKEGMNYITQEGTETLIQLIYMTSPFIVTGKSEPRTI